MGDVFEFMKDEKPSSDLGEVRRLAMRAVALEREVDDMERTLKVAKAALLELRRNTLPDAMAEHGLSEFKLADGSGIKVKNFVAGSLSQATIEKSAALALLEEHGGVDLIKNELTVSFQKKDHNRAVALLHDLQQQGYDATLDSTVHHSTLAAWCREKVRAGERLEFDKLGMYVGRETDILLPEKR